MRPVERTISADEGLHVAAHPQGLTVAVTRRDQTDVTTHGMALEPLVSQLDAPEHFFFLDEGLVRSRPEITKILPASRYAVLPSGEEHKVLATAESAISQLHRKHIHRRSLLIGVGGGALTDTVGLIANLYFRGVRVSYVPTTLLAMVDSAIGGKVAVNHPRQKNLIGSFYHPESVHICMESLRTLPGREAVSAVGEMMKVAIVGSPDLFAELESLPSLAWKDPQLQSAVLQCIELKYRLLGTNCFERSLERSLNFGHSIAHPLEDITEFRLRHGEAVGIGITVASHIAWQRGILDESSLRRIISLATRLGLPIADRDFDVHALLHRVDRLVLQRGGRSLHYVIPERIGKVRIVDYVTRREIQAALSSVQFMTQESVDAC
ncbi:3-dehydroquinate synthase [Streptomyces sp. ATCC 21386]|uniref:3-dehydroquinate synthase family protein n=1 Tax=Streptomyces sp. ATCC 21386 TaxID=2699428 RepID=UPI001BFF29FE|nr:3-dehydroquinate synthase family protein [Streptomyces sp. ATCC 21386]